MAQRPRVAGAVLAAASGLGAAGQSPIPPDGFKIAFIGDQGLGPAAQAVLQLIADERADAVVHSGDFDYDDNPQAWDQQISEILGPCFPYFASVGNHDDQRFYGPGGYQEMLADRMSCLGLAWDGDLGARSTHTYQGILFVLTAPGVFGDGDLDYAPYIRDQLAASDAIWRISSWHQERRYRLGCLRGVETGRGRHRHRPRALVRADAPAAQLSKPGRGQRGELVCDCPR
jgi:hypothetical protein